MEDRDNNKMKDLLEKFTRAAGKTISLIEAIKEKAEYLAHKGEHVLNNETKKNVKKKAIAELEELIEKLVSLNHELEMDFIDSPILSITYFTPGEDVHNLKFLSGDNPWNFWLVDRNVDAKGILKNLLQKHQDGLLEPIKTPKAAQSVCVIDRNRAMRGIILQIKNENRIKLVDCDSNVTKVVTKDKLFNVDEDACRAHASALKCTITEEPDALDLWKNPDLREVFCNTLRESNLRVKILKKMAGSFPIFVVNIELQNEDEECTASVNEWILGRLLPEIKKLGDGENDPICDFLSEESLCPYYRGDEKEINKQVSQPTNHEDNRRSEKVEESVKVSCEEMNNLNHPSEKLPEKMVIKSKPCKVDHSSEENTKHVENKGASLEEGIASSSSSEGFVTTSSNRQSSGRTDPASESKLNYHSEEFRPKVKKSLASLNRKFENKSNEQKYYPSHSPAWPGTYTQPPHPAQPWPYNDQPSEQVNNTWPYQQQMQPADSWSPGKASNEVNVMAPVFVPRIVSSNIQQPGNQEPITLRKSTTLIKENEKLLVLISHVESPSEFYVHFVNQNNKYLDKLYNDMFTYYSTKEKIEFNSWRHARSTLGRFCACKWTEDNHWYRVEVMDWTVDAGLVKVFFVDHGNTESVPLSCLQPLIKAFEKLSMCCQSCYLAKVHPLEKDQPWSEEAITFFKSKVVASNSHVYSITVVQSGGFKAIKPNSFSVLLYEGNATDSSKSINDLLVDEGFAWSRSLLTESTSSLSSGNYHSLDDLTDKLSPLDVGNLTIKASDISDNLTKAVHSPKYDLLTSSESQNDRELELWDPRRDDYESPRNVPSLDIDDACVAVSGYKPKDEARICKFYAAKGYCFKTLCTKEHSKPTPDGMTTDKEDILSVAFSQLNLPKPGEVIRLRVTYVFSVNLFYAQIEDVKGVAADDECKELAETLSSLEEAMNAPENVMQMRGLTVPPATGQSVLVREVNPDTGREWWYRGIVSASSDNPIDENPEVMFVDYGSTCTVSERDLRKMEEKYLHLPFQAIECALANIKPVENEDDNLLRGKELLEEYIEGQVVTAIVYDSEHVSDDVVRLQLLLQLDNGQDVGELLVESNVCEPQIVLRPSILDENISF